MILFVITSAGCIEEDMRGPLVLSVHDFVVVESRRVAFTLRAENTGDRVLVNISIWGDPAEATHGPVPGRIIDMPYDAIPPGSLVFDPNALLDPGASWAQALNATVDAPPAGTEADPYAFEWNVKYEDADGGRWEWLYWTCHRADGNVSKAKGCGEWFEYFPD